MPRTNIYAAAAALIIVASGFPANAGTLDEQTRKEALRSGFGLFCSVQDRDTTRANAWVQYTMGTVLFIASKDQQKAMDFAAQINGLATVAERDGGINCQDFPKLQ